MNSTQILKHCKYFIDLFEEIHQQSSVPFSSCTWELQAVKYKCTSHSDLINLQVKKINKISLCRNKKINSFKGSHRCKRKL